MYWPFICFLFGVLVGLYAYQPFYTYIRRFLAYRYILGKSAHYKKMINSFIATEPYAYTQFRSKVLTKPRNKQAYIKFLHQKQQAINDTSKELFALRSKTLLTQAIIWLVVPVFITRWYWPYYFLGFALVVAYNYFYSAFVTKNTALADAMMEKIVITAYTWEKICILSPKNKRPEQKKHSAYEPYEPTILEISVRDVIKKSAALWPAWRTLRKIYFVIIAITFSILLIQLILVISVKNIEKNADFSAIFWVTNIIFFGYSLFYWAITAIITFSYVLKQYRPK